MKDLKDLTDLKSASIIICYHNEALSVLIRMLNGIIERTPEKLIHEILLIDDASAPELIIEPELRQYGFENWNLKKFQFLRTSKRQGLIKAKILGARWATGDVLVFLDSHCEVNQKWLEPLLDRIKENPKR